MMYYKLPNGEPTSNLQRLIPQVINPKALSDEELADYSVARCVVQTPTVEYWQALGERIVDTSVSPHVISWAVETRPLEEAKTIAWDKVKAEREEKQRGLMPYEYPNGVVEHNEMTDKVIRDLSASTTAALALASQGIVDPVMPWTTHENVTHMLTPAQMIAFGLAATQWHSAIHMTSQTIRAAINDSETVQAVIAAAAWPEV